jgi:CheY-like chemotaxis protein
MGGNETGQRLRADQPTIRLIISSGYVADPVLNDPASIGFTASIAKPYAADVLSKVVASALASPA